MTLVVAAAATAPDDVAAVGVVATAGAAGAATPALHWDAARLGAAAAVTAEALVGTPDGGWLRRQGWSAKVGQSLVLRRASGAPSVVLLGLGTAPVTAEAWRRAGAALVRASGEGGTAALVLPRALPAGAGAPDAGAALAEGAVLAAYRFGEYRSTPKPAPVERLVVVGGPEGVGGGVQRGVLGASATLFARDLINTPPSDLPPRVLAERAVEALSGLAGTSVDVWDERRVAEEHLGGLLAVSRGSDEPPRLVIATYEPVAPTEPVAPAGRRPHVVLVGKGITFDSGGLSLKPADSMTTMKTDMSGAAVVLAVLSACAPLGIAVKVTAIAPMTENMPDGRAVKPGDVLSVRNGATIEVLNTDAEGRLVLADALSLAAELHPDALIDVATLTGAARIALGTGVAPLLGNDEELLAAVRRAAEVAGERVWPMPMPDDYREHIDSDVADMKNVGRSGEAGVIAAAALLARFVGDVPWAHLDIAGTGRSSEDVGYLSKGGTAFGVRMLIELLRRYDGPPAGPVGGDG